jgi:hypothetical protein
VEICRDAVDHRLCRRGRCVVLVRCHDVDVLSLNSAAEMAHATPPALLTAVLLMQLAPGIRRLGLFDGFGPPRATDHGR